MRPRFSVRWFLVGIALVAVISYLFFARPSVIAQHFVDEFERGGKARDAAFASATNSQLVHRFTLVNEDIHARLEPRTWADVWHARRRVCFEVDPHDPRLPARSWRGYEIGAGAMGLRLGGPEIDYALGNHKR